MAFSKVHLKQLKDHSHSESDDFTKSNTESRKKEVIFEEKVAKCDVVCPHCAGKFILFYFILVLGQQ